MGRVWGEQFLAGRSTQIADIATFTFDLHTEKNFLSNVYPCTFVNTESEEDGVQQHVESPFCWHLKKNRPVQQVVRFQV